MSSRAYKLMYEEKKYHDLLVLSAWGFVQNVFDWGFVQSSTTKSLPLQER